MKWWPWKREFQGVTPEGQIPPRGTARTGSVLVNEDTALRNSAVWACMRLRADLISTFPVDVFRDVDGIAYEMTKPPILVTPGGKRWPYRHWMWATQHDLDGSGNTIGLITETNALGLPARIDLFPIRVCTVIQRRGEMEPRYKIDGKEYPAAKVWHERQFPIAGLPVGLSPIAYAAWSIGESSSMQQFALDWFGGGAVPKARMRNKAKILKDKEITTAKQWYRDVITNGDIMVYGADWEYDFIQASEAGIAWIEGRKHSVMEICRFFGCPADLIEAAISGQSITYANISQRNLEFLIMHLGPAVIRREATLSEMLPTPRYVKLNTDALLRMDPQTQAMVIKTEIDSRTLTVTEARALRNRPPLTKEQEAEFNRIFPPKMAVSPPEKLAGPVAPELRDWVDAWVLDDAAPRSPIPIGGPSR